MLYLAPGTSTLTTDAADAMEASGSTTTVTAGQIVTSARPASAATVEEDDVDKFLSKQDGRIQRQKNEQ